MSRLKHKKNPKSCFGIKSLEVTEEMQDKQKLSRTHNSKFHTRSRNPVAPEKLDAIRKVAKISINIRFRTYAKLSRLDVSTKTVLEYGEAITTTLELFCVSPTILTKPKTRKTIAQLQ